jgi:hypothetical protein
MLRNSVLALVLIAAASGIARGDIIGFGGNGAGYSENQLEYNYPGPAISNDVLTITTQNLNEATSVFYQTPQSYAGGFAASFTYTDHYAGGADGFVFVLENDIHGASAVGGNGALLGYGGSKAITPSLGISFDINGGSNTGIDQNGNVDYAATRNGVDLTTNTPVDVVISYDAATSTVMETLSQGPNTYSQSSVINLASLLGDNGDAFVGFTGGTGDDYELQTISNFSYAAVPEPTAAGMLGLGIVIALARRQRAGAIAR